MPLSARFPNCITPKNSTRVPSPSGVTRYSISVAPMLPDRREPRTRGRSYAVISPAYSLTLRPSLIFKLNVAPTAFSGIKVRFEFHCFGTYGPLAAAFGIGDEVKN